MTIHQTNKNRVDKLIEDCPLPDGWSYVIYTPSGRHGYTTDSVLVCYTGDKPHNRFVAAKRGLPVVALPINPGKSRSPKTVAAVKYARKLIANYVENSEVPR
jgi:hypothetical protein